MLLLKLALAHDPTSCEQVRHTRQLAVAAGLDTIAIDTLAGRVCEDAPPSPAGNACQDLLAVSLMVAIEGSEGMEEVHEKRSVACSVGVEEIPRWTNGYPAQTGDGWKYPNGYVAIVGDTWKYPNGYVARVDDSWKYPSGYVARTDDGTWKKPDGYRIGTQDQLMLWACEQDREACIATAEAMKSIHDPDLRTLLLIQLAWSVKE